MSLFAHRRPGADGVVTLRTLPDLERYCYFVAGTVGQMLTGLFLAQMPDIASERAACMRANAESFGLGLQMVNILKDQTDDLARGWCFIPRTMWEARGLEPRRMLDPERREDAHAAIEPVFKRTRRYLGDALEFTLAIPPEQAGIRLFCILPLWMAARTLSHAHGNDAMFVADRPVKISRDEVARLIGQAMAAVEDDEALRAQFGELMA
jgi:farnesyl-diphosphate farnesyltransferase